jgi:ribosomal protein S21
VRPGAEAFRLDESRLHDAPVVTLWSGEDLDSALRRLKRRMDRAGISSALKRHVAAMSRGARRRQKDPGPSGGRGGPLFSRAPGRPGGSGGRDSLIPGSPPGRPLGVSPRGAWARWRGLA